MFDLGRHGSCLLRKEQLHLYLSTTDITITTKSEDPDIDIKI